MKTLRFKLALARLLIPLAGLLCGLAGCVTDSAPDLVIGPVRKPRNVYTSVPALPAQARRVAVLPLTTDVNGPMGEHGVETLQPVVNAELLGAKVFELVFVAPEQMKQWTGKTAWKAEEALPANFFVHLRDKLGCDAVLFVRLTAYRAYPPLVIGWNVKLADHSGKTIWWSVDEVFDAGDPAVVNGARFYYQAHTREQSPLNDSRSILNSPLRFGQYAFSTVLGTLPNRAPVAITAKVSASTADK